MDISECDNGACYNENLIESLQVQLSLAIKALEFYADSANWHISDSAWMEKLEVGVDSEWIGDLKVGGRLARKTIKEINSL